MGRVAVVLRMKRRRKKKTHMGVWVGVPVTGDMCWWWRRVEALGLNADGSSGGPQAARDRCLRSADGAEKDTQEQQQEAFDYVTGVHAHLVITGCRPSARANRAGEELGWAECGLVVGV